VFARIEVTVTKDRKESRRATALCPFCGRLHAHRLPWGRAEPAERAAHCGGGRYRIGVSR
jgi:hypothetical protein